MKAKTIMVQGTTSNAGKSALSTALCSIFAADGLKVAPFKAWNMSSRYYQTADRLKIGVAQGVQAELLGLKACGAMNPLYLRPVKGKATEVYVRGVLQETAPSQDYARVVIKKSLRELQEQYDVIVMEGAGSPVELNIKHKEVANMSVAKLNDTPVLLVADIHRGGALAGIVGTIDLLERAEQELVIGSVLNKFRGDPQILQPGLQVIEQYTKKPVLGVLPFYEQIGLPAEDLAEQAQINPFSPSEFAGFVRTVQENLDLNYIRKKMGLRQEGCKWVPQ